MQEPAGQRTLARLASGLNGVPLDGGSLHRMLDALQRQLTRVDHGVGDLGAPFAGRAGLLCAFAGLLLGPRGPAQALGLASNAASALFGRALREPRLDLFLPDDAQLLDGDVALGGVRVVLDRLLGDGGETLLQLGELDVGLCPALLDLRALAAQALDLRLRGTSRLLHAVEPLRRPRAPHLGFAEGFLRLPDLFAARLLLRAGAFQFGGEALQLPLRRAQPFTCFVDRGLDFDHALAGRGPARHPAGADDVTGRRHRPDVGVRRDQLTGSFEVTDQGELLQRLLDGGTQLVRCRDDLAGPTRAVRQRRPG